MCIFTPNTQILITNLNSKNIKSHIINPLNHYSKKPPKKP